MTKTADFCSMMYELFKEYENRLLAEKKARGVLEHNDIRWIRVDEIPNYTFCPADEEILNKIIEISKNGRMKDNA